ncbi:MAG: hypothetical protein LBE21_02930 [Pseudomonadales bacterium]|jgi:predicted nucleic acid-binding protein|nr:hypothetical protein [Pseudomonadales bacterium]
MSGKSLVIDANILIRAVLGRRARDLLFTHADTVRFYAPDVAYADARHYLPGLLIRRGLDPAAAMLVLDQLEIIVRPVDAELYETQALRRIESRDADDWPVLACAILLNCPIWTEDADFFGTGVATWTSDRVELYLMAE